MKKIVALIKQGLTIESAFKLSMLLLTGGLYLLQVNFIPRKEFQQEKEAAMRQYQEDKREWWAQLRGVNDALTRLDKTISLFQVNTSRIEDHEQRLRDLERNEPRPWQQQRRTNGVGKSGQATTSTQSAHDSGSKN